MAHLPVRELQDRAGVINVTPAFQFCVQRTYLNSVLAKTSDIVVAVGGVLILVLLNLWNPAVGESTYNNVIVYSITGIAFLISLATAVSHRFNFERNATRYQTASRAIRRLRDSYELALKRYPDNPDQIQALGVWAKSHVYTIEALLQDDKIPDVDSAFCLSPPPDPGMPLPSRRA